MRGGVEESALVAALGVPGSPAVPWRDKGAIAAACSSPKPLTSWICGAEPLLMRSGDFISPSLATSQRG